MQCLDAVGNAVGREEDEKADNEPDTAGRETAGRSGTVFMTAFLASEEPFREKPFSRIGRSVYRRRQAATRAGDVQSWFTSCGI